MVKIAIDANHGLKNLGEMLPEDDQDWICNEKVVRAAIDKLKTYKDVEILRVDDSTGKLDIPLTIRTNRAIEWEADVYVAIHNNSGIGSRRKTNSVESFSLDLLKNYLNYKGSPYRTYPRIVRPMGNQDGGTISMNFHVLRDSLMPVIVREGGFLNSEVNIIKLCSEKLMAAEGEGIADGLAAYIKLKPMSEIHSMLNNPSSDELIEATTIVVYYLESIEKGVIPEKWMKKIENGTLHESDAIGLLYVVLHRWLSK